MHVLEGAQIPIIEHPQISVRLHTPSLFISRDQNRTSDPWNPFVEVGTL